jgi:hypothetical protein
MNKEWLTTVILATQEARLRRVNIQSQSGQIVHKTQFGKTPIHKKGAGGVAQGVSSEFKPQYHEKIKKKHGIYIQWNIISLELGDF